MRVVQRTGVRVRGSLKWMQRMVDSPTTVLVEQLREVGALQATDQLEWRSPLRCDDWAEYRDAAFLERVGLERLAPSLAAFWPARGPQWDALAVAPDGSVFLFEAKAHLMEMSSTCQARADSSRRLINKAFSTAKAALRVPETADWLSGFYQYANRLAHLYFLRKHGVRASLVLVYFTGDQEVGGPLSPAEWTPHLKAVHRHLGLSEPVPGVVNPSSRIRGVGRG
jgi:hypothetical protein